MEFSGGQLDIFFRPVIDPRNMQVRIYRVIPVLTTAEGVRVGVKQVLEHGGDPVDTAMRNVLVIQQAAMALSAAHDAGNQVFLMFPVSARAMETKESATIVVKGIKGLADVCAKAGILHLFDLRDRPRLNDLDGLVIPLLIRFDKYVIEPPAGLEDYVAISSCNAQGVVIDMGPEHISEKDLTALWSRAAPRRLGVFVQNVCDGAVIPLAQRYESRGIDGPIFGDMSADIGPRETFENLETFEDVSVPGE